MDKNLGWLALLLCVTVGCADTWGRESAIEIPLHRDLMGLHAAPPQPCPLKTKKWEALCVGEGSHPDCPPECVERPSDEKP